MVYGRFRGWFEVGERLNGLREETDVVVEILKGSKVKMQVALISRLAIFRVESLDPLQSRR